MSQRLTGKTDEEILTELNSITQKLITPILCIGPVREEDTLE